MIVQSKKLDPLIGMVLSIIFFSFGLFVIIFLTIHNTLIYVDLYFIIGFLFFIVGGGLLRKNALSLGVQRISNQIDENLKSMNPEIYVFSFFLTFKIGDFYIVKYSARDNYLHFIKMNEKIPISVSWLRRELMGPKLPTRFPVVCPSITEVDDFKIRKCESKITLFDVADNQWYSGQATMFSIFFFSKSIFQALKPNILQDIIATIEHYI